MEKLNLNLNMNFDKKSDNKLNIEDVNVVNKESNISVVDNSVSKTSNREGGMVLVNSTNNENINETKNDNVKKITSSDSVDQNSSDSQKTSSGGGIILNEKLIFLIILLAIYFLKRN